MKEGLSKYMVNCSERSNYAPFGHSQRRIRECVDLVWGLGQACSLVSRRVTESS